MEPFETEHRMALDLVMQNVALTLLGRNMYPQGILAFSLSDFRMLVLNWLTSTSLVCTNGESDAEGDAEVVMCSLAPDRVERVVGAIASKVLESLSRGEGQKTTRADTLF